MFGGICGTDNSGNGKVESFGALFGQYVNCENFGELTSESSDDRSGNIVGGINSPSHVKISEIEV